MSGEGKESSFQARDGGSKWMGSGNGHALEIVCRCGRLLPLRKKSLPLFPRLRYRPHVMKKLIVRILILVVLLVVVALGAGVFFLGSIVKKGVEKVGPSVTKVSVKLDSAIISVFGGSGELKGFVVGNPDGFKSPEAMKVGTMSLKLSPMSIFGDKVVIQSIKVLEPEITLETCLLYTSPSPRDS